MAKKYDQKNILRGSVKQYLNPTEPVGDYHEEVDTDRISDENSDLPKQFIKDAIEAKKRIEKGETESYRRGERVSITLTAEEYGWFVKKLESEPEENPRLMELLKRKTLWV